MSKSEALYQKELEKRFEKSLRLMEYKYLSTKYKQDKKHKSGNEDYLGKVA